MASKTLIELTTDTPATTDLLYYVKNPGGTPLDRAVTLTALKGAVAPALTEHYIGFGSASNTITGDAGFTFDPTASGGNGARIGLDLPAGFTAFNVEADLTPIADGTETATAVGIESYTVGDKNASQLFGMVVTSQHYSAGTLGSLFGLQIETGQFGGVLTTQTALSILDVSGASTNRAIQTGAGDIVFGSLAGTGSRPVVADANGKLSAL